MPRGVGEIATACGIALVALTGCSSSGHHPALSQATRPAIVASPPDNLASAASTDLAGRATVTVPGQPPTVVTLTQSPDDPVTVDQTADGATTLNLSLGDTAGDTLSIDGTVRTGHGNAHVSLFIDSFGVLVDTAQGGECHTTFTSVSETNVAGTTSCLTTVGQRQATVTAQFSAT